MHEQLQVFDEVAQAPPSKAGSKVLGIEMSSAAYDERHAVYGQHRSMKEPRNYRVPHRGYLVVRHPGTTDACETWMPRHVFLRRYRLTSTPDATVSEFPRASDMRGDNTPAPQGFTTAPTR